MKVCIDPAHGGRDSGAVGPTGVKEKSVVRDIAHHLECGFNSCGIAAYRTRLGDETLSLSKRCEIANASGANLFLSLHANASTNPQAHDFEVWTSPGFTAADPYATRIFNTVTAAFPELNGRRDSSDGDPDKESKFYVLIHTKMPAVLIETAFISNPEEERWLTDPGWRMRMAGAVVSALWTRR